MTAAVAARGTLLQIGDGATPTENFTTIASVKDIAGPQIKQKIELVTSHDSPSGWAEKIPTIIDAGNVTLKCNAIIQNSTQSYTTGLLRDQVNRTLRHFKLIQTDPGATVWQFSAFVADFKLTFNVDKAAELDITLDISGVPTLA